MRVIYKKMCVIYKMKLNKALLVAVLVSIVLILTIKCFPPLPALAIFFYSSNDLHTYLRNYNCFLRKSIKITEQGYVPRSAEPTVFLFNHPPVAIWELIALLEEYTSNYKIVTNDPSFYFIFKEQLVKNQLTIPQSLPTEVRRELVCQKMTQCLEIDKQHVVLFHEGVLSPSFNSFRPCKLTYCNFLIEHSARFQIVTVNVKQTMYSKYLMRLKPKMTISWSEPNSGANFSTAKELQAFVAREHNSYLQN